MTNVSRWYFHEKLLSLHDIVQILNTWYPGVFNFLLVIAVKHFGEQASKKGRVMAIKQLRQEMDYFNGTIPIRNNEVIEVPTIDTSALFVHTDFSQRTESVGISLPVGK